MPSKAATPLRHAAEGHPEPLSRPLIAGLAAILAVTLLRVGFALADRTELSTDEAQYWLWGQSLDWGYYSKPPLIGWVIRATTELFGQSVWAVRLPAALFHGLTALVILVIARRLMPPGAAVLAALSYLTLPAVALGSALMTTDTPMLLAAAVALWAQLRLAEARAAGQGALGLAAILGLALGLGLLAKHAMVFWLGGAALAALMVPALRPRLREALVAAAVFLAVIAPHLAWLAETRFVTVAHVQDITRGAGLSLLRPLRFLAEQALVMGPVLIVALGLVLGQVAARPRGAGAMGGLALLAAMPLLIVTLQGVQGPVQANWAALYLVPGSILAATWLARRPRLALLSLALGAVVLLALPLAKIFGTGLEQPDGRLLLARYLGHGEVARWALAQGEGQGSAVLVARDRDLLADLSWFGAGSGLAVRAVPPQGMPRHHWELAAAFDPARDAGPVLLLLRSDAPAICPGAETIARHVAGPGFAEGDTLVLLRPADASCLVPAPTAGLP
jgi:4-amino-4-deoxy-L-arabinose transferase-like glycosyltransferase